MALCFVVACGPSATPAPEAVVVGEMGEADPEARPEPEPAPDSVGQPSYGTLSVYPGFVPDPVVAEGQAGGPRDASGFDPACVGWITEDVSHLLEIRADFSMLRVVVRSPGDTTLVIRRPDQTFVCNDDYEGLNPAIESAFPTGLYEVWVGSYEQGVRHAYKIGLSELSSVTPSSLP